MNILLLSIKKIILIILYLFEENIKKMNYLYNNKDDENISMEVNSNRFIYGYTNLLIVIKNLDYYKNGKNIELDFITEKYYSWNKAGLKIKELFIQNFYYLNDNIIELYIILNSYHKDSIFNINFRIFNFFRINKISWK